MLYAFPEVCTKLSLHCNLCVFPNVLGCFTLGCQLMTPALVLVALFNRFYTCKFHQIIKINSTELDTSPNILVSDMLKTNCIIIEMVMKRV